MTIAQKVLAVKFVILEQKSESMSVPNVESKQVTNHLSVKDVELEQTLRNSIVNNVDEMQNYLLDKQQLQKLLPLSNLLQNLKKVPVTAWTTMAMW